MMHGIGCLRVTLRVTVEKLVQPIPSTGDPVLSVLHPSG